MQVDSEHATNAAIADTTSEFAIRSALEAHADEILNTLRMFVIRGRLAHRESVADITLDLFGELFVEAMRRAERYDPTRRPLPWLLGIGANLVRRKQEEQAQHAKRAKREPLVQDLAVEGEEPMSDDDLFHLVAGAANSAASEHLEAKARVDDLLSLASKEDQRVIRLAIVQELDGKELARELGVSEGAARTRLHRAVARLREAHKRRAAEDDGVEL